MALLAYFIVRPWAMGVWINPTDVRIVSWYRTYRIPLNEIEAVELSPYSGMVSFGVGWVPFVGRVRMLNFHLVGDKQRDFPSTVGTRRTAWRLAKAILPDVAVMEWGGQAR